MHKCNLILNPEVAALLCERARNGGGEIRLVFKTRDVLRLLLPGPDLPRKRSLDRRFMDSLESSSKV
jgi:hypothetical protein